MTFSIDYDKMLMLDAEDLAEGGIKKLYERNRTALCPYIKDPAPIEELLDPNTPSYTVRSGKNEYHIYSPSLPDSDGEAWGRAAFAFFKIVNDQLSDSTHRLYAVNGGNDLGGVFLTEAESQAARRSLPRKADWPYNVTPEHPWYGQHHD